MDSALPAPVKPIHMLGELGSELSHPGTRHVVHICILLLPACAACVAHTANLAFHAGEFPGFDLLHPCSDLQEFTPVLLKAAT